jgi:hypothetical protein
MSGRRGREGAARGSRRQRPAAGFSDVAPTRVPTSTKTNGHGRAAYLGDPRPMISNLFFTSSAAFPPDELKKKFMDSCKQNGNKWCLIVREMDNPVLGVREQEDLSEIVMGAASGAATGDRLPLLVYRVNVDDGRNR